jgi:hypothetical protein
MAEIHVRAKKNNASNTMWIWIIIALAVVAAVIYFVMRNNEATPNNTTTPAYPTSQVQSINDLLALNAV